MEVAFGGLVEDALGEGGRGLRSVGADGPEDDVELWRRDWSDEVRRPGETLVKFECGGTAGFEALRECATGSVREQLLCGPESDGGGSGAGALEGDLAEVETL